jgi:hypothetical protein
MVLIFCSPEWTQQAELAARSARKSNIVALTVEVPELRADGCSVVSVTRQGVEHLETVVNGDREAHR